MDLYNLQQHIRTLATLEETGAPVVSYYLNRAEAPDQNRLLLSEQERILRRTLPPKARQGFIEAMEQIETFLDTAVQPETKGVALFVRSGEAPFFLPLQFHLPLPTWLSVSTMPNIYHLVELKDTYHRYIILISTETQARIVEVNLGAVTKTLWHERPELRKRVGREWTREHYQNHRRHRTEQFIKEKIKVLEALMAAGGHTHLILAGNPRMTAQVRKALPKQVADKVVDMAVSGSPDDLEQVVAATLTQFIEWEEQESLALVDRLFQELLSGGLAVVGAEACLRTLARGQADVLVIAKEMPNVILRERLAKMAAQSECHVEVVNDSSLLLEFDGVGCLLRYA